MTCPAQTRPRIVPFLWCLCCEEMLDHVLIATSYQMLGYRHLPQHGTTRTAIITWAQVYESSSSGSHFLDTMQRGWIFSGE